MSDQFVAEIRMFPFNFAPTGWAFCNGQILPLSQNTALFSLLGTTYGGDGKSTFALPDLQGAAPLHIGSSQPGPGLSTYDLGEQTGVDYVTLLQSEMPNHPHTMNAANFPSDQATPDPTRSLARTVNGAAYIDQSGQTLVNMDFGTLSVTGGSQPHNNLMPYLAVNFCIALQGIFPARP
jgi:microcystin-dependent protein